MTILERNQTGQSAAEVEYRNPSEPAYFTAREVIYSYLAILAFFVAVLSPYLLIDFAHSDDWNLFKPEFYSNELPIELRAGRFLFIVILRAAIFPIIRFNHSLSVLPYIRVASIAALAGAATLFAIHQRQFRHSRLTVLCTSGLIFILPGAVYYAEHAMEFVLVIGTAFGLVGGILLTSCRDRILRVRDMSRRDWLLCSAAVLLLLLSCNIYQSSAMFFLLPIVSTLLFGPDQTRMRVILAIAQVGVFCAGLLLYFLLNKFIIIPVGAVWLPAVNGAEIADYRFDLGSDLLGRLVIALNALLPAAARLWWFEFRYAEYVVMLAMILGTLALVFRRNRDRLKGQSLVPPLEPLLMLAFVLCAGILVNSPAIISTVDGSRLRLLFPCSALFVLFLVWIGMGLLQRAQGKFRVILVAALAVAGVSAHLTAQSSATNSSVEVTILREAIGRLVQSKTPVRELFVIRPPDFPTYVGARAFSSDEFYTPSSLYEDFAFEMVRVLSLRAQTPWAMIYQLPIQPVFDRAYYYEEGVFDGSDQAIYAAACGSGLTYLHEGTVIADMAAPLYLAPRVMGGNNRASCVRELAYYDASPDVSYDLPAVSSTHSSVRLFDNRELPDSFWEAQPYPVVFRVRYVKPKTVQSYTLGAAAFAPERMPVSWRFEASGDDGAWTTLDEQRDQARWLAGEQREYPIVKADAYKYYRLVFTKGSEELLRVGKININVSDVGELPWIISYTGASDQPVVDEVKRPHGTYFVEGFVNGNIRVEMNFPECRLYSRYRFWVGSHGADSTDRQPREWKLFVRGRETGWALADSEQMNDGYSNDKWYSFALHSQNCIQHVRWEIGGVRRGHFFRLFDFQLY